MSDLADFLTAQYDRIEKAARRAAERSATWQVNGTWHLEGVEHSMVGEEEAFCRPHNVEHIALHDPAYVLADITSKRKTLKLHYVVGFEDEDGHDIGHGCAECGYSAEYSDRGRWCETIRLLAAPFSGEPGYDAERWAA